MTLELQVKVSLCGEDKAALPIKVEDAAEGLNLEFVQMVPGSKDIEGRQVRGKEGHLCHVNLQPLRWW